MRPCSTVAHSIFAIPSVPRITGGMAIREGMIIVRTPNTSSRLIIVARIFSIVLI